MLIMSQGGLAVSAEKNPETANRPGRARRAVLTGGAIGLAAAAGAALGGAQPASAQDTATLTEITPTVPADTTGVSDTKALINAINGLPAGGVVYLGPGDFYITCVPGYSNNVTGYTSITNAAIVVPAQTSTGSTGGKGVSIQGSGSATVLHVVGSYTGIYCHRTTSYGTLAPAPQTTVFLRDFVVDGTNAGTAIGVDIGDGWGYDLDLAIVNFTTSGSIGLNIINRIFWTEKGRFRAHLMNNATAAVLDSVASNEDISHEYNFFDFNMACNENQNGVVVQNGVNVAGCSLWLHGNMINSSSPPNPIAALTVSGVDTGTPPNYSRIFASEIVMKVEGNNRSNTTTPVYPYGIYLNSDNNAIQQCQGIILHSLNNSSLNSGEFSFRGLICGDASLYNAYTGAPGSGQTSTSEPELPSSGTLQQNYGPDQMVYVTGGSVSAIEVNKVLTGQTSGCFFIPAGGTIKLTYSGQPSWTWVPAAYSAY
jgi:hypothetical protein